MSVLHLKIIQILRYLIKSIFLFFKNADPFLLKYSWFTMFC